MKLTRYHIDDGDIVEMDEGRWVEADDALEIISELTQRDKESRELITELRRSSLEWHPVEDGQVQDEIRLLVQSEYDGEIEHDFAYFESEDQCWFMDDGYPVRGVVTHYCESVPGPVAGPQVSER